VVRADEILTVLDAVPFRSGHPTDVGDAFGPTSPKYFGHFLVDPKLRL